ncbi:MAG: hemolysin family protein [Acidimicrobiia bacterium]
MSTTAGLALVAFLLIVNAFFVAGEFALVTVERSRVARRAGEGDRSAKRIHNGLSRLSFHLSGAQLGITVSSLILGLVAEQALSPLIEPVLGWFNLSETARAPVTVVIALAIGTALQLVLGELVPKNIAISHPYPTAMRVGVPMLVLNGVLSPVISFLNSAANRTVRLMGIEPREELAGVRSLEELELIIRASGEGGMLSNEELALLTRSIAFTENLTSDVMIPRVQVVGLPVTATVRDLQRAAVESGHSRFPVYGADLDDIRGVAHVKDSLRVPVTQRDSAAIADHMRPALVIPDTQRLDTVLFELRTRGSGMAVVTDEYGGTAGIVTSEDLLEEIVGEIRDEHDIDEVTPEDDSDSLSGLLHRHEVESEIGFAWPEGRYETLGGLLTAELGRLPEPGDQVTIEGWTFQVESVDGFRVETASLVSAPETP